MHSAYAASDVGTLITLKNDTGETIDLKKLYYNTLFDYPEETFFAKTRFSYYKLTCAPGEDIRIIPDYYPGLDEAAYRQRVDEAAEACFLPGMTALEKVTAAHDWLVLNRQYDPYVANGEQPYEAADGTVYGDNPLVFTSYGLFTEGNAVCQGYALAFKVLMNRAGIPCCYVNGKGHAWNGVQLDGEWYYVDVTWDDPVNIGTTGDFSGMVRRTNFLLGEENFGHQTCAPWTTEYDYAFSETDCALPTGLANAQSMAAYLIDGAFYLADSSGVLYRYALGSGFQSGEAVSSDLPTSIRAAALDADGNTLYFLSNYSTNADHSEYWWHLYALELNDAEPAVKLLQYTKPTASRWECGIRIRENPDVPGTKELCTWYDYAPAERIPIGLGATDETMPVVIWYDASMTQLSAFPGKSIRVEAQEDCTVYLALYDGNGRMLKAGELGFAAAGGETVLHIDKSAVPSGAASGCIMALSGEMVPLASALIGV